MAFIQQLNQYDAVEDKVHQIGYDHLFSTMSYTIFSEKPKINTHKFTLTNIGDWQRPDSKLFRYSLNFNYEIALANTSRITARFSPNYRYLLFPFTFTDNPLPSEAYRWNEFQIDYRSDRRKILIVGTGKVFPLR